MKRINNKIIVIWILMGVGLFIQSCHIGVTDPNQPTTDVLNSAVGILAFAKGGPYNGAFSSGTSASYYPTLDDALGEGELSIVQAFYESMGDLIFCPYGNSDFKFLDNPTSWVLDDGSTVLNPIGQGQPHEIKLRNDRAYGATNSMLHEWTYMYVLNNNANQLLADIDGTTFTGDQTTIKAVLKAWAYWWKGYAYSKIGSLYIAGVIDDMPNQTNGNYVTNAAILTEATKNFNAAITVLQTLSVNDAYTNTLQTIIPGTSLSGSAYMNAGVPTPTEWIHSINTMMARNIVANSRVADLQASDWNKCFNTYQRRIEAEGSSLCC